MNKNYKQIAETNAEFNLLNSELEKITIDCRFIIFTYLTDSELLRMVLVSQLYRRLVQRIIDSRRRNINYDFITALCKGHVLSLPIKAPVERSLVDILKVHGDSYLVDYINSRLTIKTPLERVNDIVKAAPKDELKLILDILVVSEINDIIEIVEVHNLRFMYPTILNNLTSEAKPYVKSTIKSIVKYVANYNSQPVFDVDLRKLSLDMCYFAMSGCVISDNVENLKSFRDVLTTSSNADDYVSELLNIAVSHGATKCFKYLMPKVTDTYYINNSYVAKKSNLEMFVFYTSHSGINPMSSEILISVASGFCLDKFKYILQYHDDQTIDWPVLLSNVIYYKIVDHILEIHNFTNAEITRLFEYDLTDTVFSRFRRYYYLSDSLIATKITNTGNYFNKYLLQTLYPCDIYIRKTRPKDFYYEYMMWKNQNEFTHVTTKLNKLIDVIHLKNPKKVLRYACENDCEIIVRNVLEHHNFSLLYLQNRIANCSPRIRHILESYASDRKYKK